MNIAPAGAPTVAPSQVTSSTPEAQEPPGTYDHDADDGQAAARPALPPGVGANVDKTA